MWDRRAPLACLLVAAGLAAGGGGGGRAAAPPVKNVNGWITALAMDGPVVAYATETFAPDTCFKVFAWNVATRGGFLVSGPKRGRCGSDEPHGQLVRELAVAGARVAWIRVIYGNTEAYETLFAASLPAPREVRVATATRTGESTQKGGWLGGLVGSGAVLAANAWTTGASGAVVRASLNAVGPRRLAPLASGPATITAESADSGRIAVARADGSVAIHASTGRLLRRIRPTSLGAIALRKDYLVVLTRTRTLEIYNARSGAFVRRWPVPGGAANLDVHSNIAVYSVYRTLYGLQLTTGKQVVLASERRRIAAAQIEAPGVVYAYDSIRGLRSIGNLVFLPLARVSAALS